jgi:2-polyprenyl-3-methyl-5-hydroxy-6-metoxy-1,4-benzoquinol methylase
MDYDEAYSEAVAYFGDAPDPLLLNFDQLIDPALPTIDVGCGQGRNAVHLARKGIKVEAIDPSHVAIEQVQRIASAERLPIHAIRARFETARPTHPRYGAVLIFGLVQEFEWPTVYALIAFGHRQLAPGGYLFTTAFSTIDPAFAFHSTTWEDLGHNSFRGPNGVVRTYLEPDQIVSLFADLEVIHHWEGLGPEHTHGDGLPERHGRIEAIFRAPAR